jgi:hypothetical protein
VQEDDDAARQPYPIARVLLYHLTGDPETVVGRECGVDVRCTVVERLHPYPRYSMQILPFLADDSIATAIFIYNVVSPQCWDGTRLL